MKEIEAIVNLQKYIRTEEARNSVRYWIVGVSVIDNPFKKLQEYLNCPISLFIYLKKFLNFLVNF